MYPLRSTKAKETKHLCRALATVWPQWMDEDKEAHLHINRTLECLVDVYDLAGVPGLFLTEAQQARMWDTLKQLLAHYSWLA